MKKLIRRLLAASMIVPLFSLPAMGQSDNRAAAPVKPDSGGSTAPS